MPAAVFLESTNQLVFQQVNQVSDTNLNSKAWVAEMLKYLSSLVGSHNEIKSRFLRKVYKAIHEIRQEIERAEYFENHMMMSDPFFLLSLCNLQMNLDQITSAAALARTLPETGPKSINALYIRFLLGSLHTALIEFCNYLNV